MSKSRLAAIFLFASVTSKAAYAQEITSTATGGPGVPATTSVDIVLTADQDPSVSIKVRGRSNNGLFGAQTGDVGSVTFSPFTFTGGLTGSNPWETDAIHPNGSITLIALAEIEYLFAGTSTGVINISGTNSGDATGHVACNPGSNPWGDGGSFNANIDAQTGGACVSTPILGSIQVIPVDFAIHVPPSASAAQTSTITVNITGTL